MDFMKGFGKRVTETAKVAAQKTASAAEMVKLNGKISALSAEVEKLYTQIGRAYYAARAEGAAEDVSALCACIDEFQKQIDAVNQQIEEMSDTRRCPGCGAKRAKDVKFCPDCGAKLVADEPERSAEVVISWPGAEQSEAEEEIKGEEE